MSKKHILIVITATVFSIVLHTLYAAPKSTNIEHHTEDYYQQKIAEKIGGKREFILADKTRIDILTKTEAIEVEFAHKFYEAIGQSAYYSSQTGKIPAIWLIRESDRDDKYIGRCKKLCENYVFVKVSEKLVKIKVNIYDNTIR